MVSKVVAFILSMLLHGAVGGQLLKPLMRKASSDVLAESTSVSDGVASKASSDVLTEAIASNVVSDEVANKASSEFLTESFASTDVMDADDSSDSSSKSKSESKGKGGKRGSSDSSSDRRRRPTTTTTTTLSPEEIAMAEAKGLVANIAEDMTQIHKKRLELHGFMIDLVQAKADLEKAVFQPCMESIQQMKEANENGGFDGSRLTLVGYKENPAEGRCGFCRCDTTDPQCPRSMGRISSEFKAESLTDCLKQAAELPECKDRHAVGSGCVAIEYYQGRKKCEVHDVVTYSAKGTSGQKNGVCLMLQPSEVPTS
jgi:hypothetical protein